MKMNWKYNFQTASTHCVLRKL